MFLLIVQDTRSNFREVSRREYPSRERAQAEALAINCKPFTPFYAFAQETKESMDRREAVRQAREVAQMRRQR